MLFSPSQQAGCRVRGEVWAGARGGTDHDEDFDAEERFGVREGPSWVARWLMMPLNTVIVTLSWSVVARRAPLQKPSWRTIVIAGEGWTDDVGATGLLTRRWYVTRCARATTIGTQDADDNPGLAKGAGPKESSQGV